MNRLYTLILNLRYFYLFLFFSCFILSFKQLAEDKFPWNSVQKLVWQNFNGKPNPLSKFSATTVSGITMGFYSKKDTLYVMIKAEFFKTESWVKSELRSEELLIHEQLHFDITELYARKLRKELSLANIKKSIASEKINLIKSNNNIELNKCQELYDLETNHRLNHKKQSDWIVKIHSEMKKLDKYQNHLLKVQLEF